ncbi:TPA: N-acetylmuramoyl-L-alanine amidase [Legionella anisa]|uniref:N-acetylmuramoyl-L-alanine amidase family protein n=1 Tax=Legionella anisa TaxID=28082 RepID=UPI00038174C4|nr:N-acetylmuramoyl-L-alanine amidase [Legionella anisa]AWN72602.1 AMIN domain-containing protein [Legionella anisa]MBN5935670.1 N-acetylmuramoyl-L-alanine amidase [Legionella anisa]MCW8423377.1 N-acetylmuramoyl-L-alanine amidase [Legionella anisa]MCW8446897.1 N-acetylmuramoyl-L-alanine amidase [Legionella anisa]
MIFRTWCFVVMCLCSIATFSAQLHSVVLKQQGNQTSLFLTINGPFTHKLFFLDHPARVVLDLKETQLAVDLNQLGLINGLVKQVRSGHSEPRTLRLVFEVNQKVQLRSSPWKPNGAFGGIRVDLVHSGRLVAPIAASIPKTAPGVLKTYTKPNIQQAKLPAKTEPKQPVHPILANQNPIKVNSRPTKLRDVIVVLDAGHGGKDPGARGPRKSREKDVVLAITLKLKQLIDRQPGMRAVLTRSGDYYVGLRQRLDIARKYNGDVFVAIHADAFNNPHSNGASVFALSQRGATSEAARWLAEKENYSELGGVNLGDLDDQNGVVRSVLIDLSQTATINSGLQMGGRVLNQLGNFTNLHNNKVEQAGFVVLKSADIPSILVETGFISNPIEERNLTNPAYQARLSQAIFQGIKGYFWENPPHGSRIEAMTTSNIHLVRAGETLPAIAARYHVSVAALQAMNHLRGITRLKPGQKLVIPQAWA